MFCKFHHSYWVFSFQVDWQMNIPGFINSGTFLITWYFYVHFDFNYLIEGFLETLYRIIFSFQPAEPEQPEATPSTPEVSEPVEETPKPSVPEEPVAEVTTESSKTPSPTPTDDSVPKVEIKIEDGNVELEEGEIVDDEEEEVMNMGLRYKYSEGKDDLIPDSVSIP